MLDMDKCPFVLYHGKDRSPPLANLRTCLDFGRNDLRIHSPDVHKGDRPVETELHRNKLLQAYHPAAKTPHRFQTSVPLPPPSQIDTVLHSLGSRPAIQTTELEIAGIVGKR